MEIKGFVRLITVQFSFSNRGIIPTLLKLLERETKAQSAIRKTRASGILQIEPTEKVSITEFPEDLLRNGYVMTDAFYQLRQFQAKTYHTVRFTFVRHDYYVVPEIPETFVALLGHTNAEFQKICDLAFWRVRAFKTPFFENDTPIDGQYAVIVNLEARVPLTEPSGKPVVEWKKDVDGNRIGDMAVPIEPNGYLRVQEGQICLLVSDLEMTEQVEA